MGEFGQGPPRCDHCGGRGLWEPLEREWHCLLCGREVLAPGARDLARIRADELAEMEALRRLLEAG